LPSGTCHPKLLPLGALEFIEVQPDRLSKAIASSKVNRFLIAYPSL
jgi:hypothetical protein